jgi:UDP-N-acetylbacillosamine N-acetyltransferase
MAEASGVKELRKILIAGAGGHARVVASILAHDAGVTLVGVADRTADHFGEQIGTTKVVATLDDRDDWRRLGVDAVALAIGDNRTRLALFEELERDGWEIASAIHPSAIIESNATLGRGVVVCAGAVVAAEVVVGENSLLNTRSIIDHECRIGRHVHIGPGSVLAGRVTVGEQTFVGAGCTVRDRIKIGARALIGCGSVVVEDVADNVVAFGTPARARREQE